MELLLQAGIHLIKKVITFVIYGRSVQVFKACTLFYFFSAEFFFSQIFLRGEGLVPQISQIYTDFLHHDFFSSDFTDESEGILACRITHGISRNFGRWPMARALYIPLLFFVTQISLMTQIFLRGRVLSHRFHRYTQIFFIMIFLHRISRMNRKAFLLIGLLTEFRRTLAAGQWLAPYIYSCCFLSRRFR